MIWFFIGSLLIVQMVIKTVILSGFLTVLQKEQYGSDHAYHAEDGNSLFRQRLGEKQLKESFLIAKPMVDRPQGAIPVVQDHHQPFDEEGGDSEGCQGIWVVGQRGVIDPDHAREEIGGDEAVNGADEGDHWVFHGVSPGS